MLKKISIEETYKPIYNQLTQLEETLIGTIRSLCPPAVLDVFSHSFKIPGKRLRPALLFLSAKAINQELSFDTESKLIQMAVALELIHSASLVHDDIIDEDLTRRGQKTLNNRFGNKIAVLAGDALYSRAFLIIARQFPKDIEEQVIQMIETMCLSEMEQLRLSDVIPTREEYLKLIYGKTALFMADCSRFGADLAGGSNNDIICLEKYGLNFGMAYQIIDDYIDKDATSLKYTGLQDALHYAEEAKKSIAGLKDSIYKEKLIDFLYFILDYPNECI